MPEWLPIFGSHVKRIGWLRTIIGGFPMYIGVPFFLLFHLVCLVLYFKGILQPLLHLDKLEFRNYLVMDRHRIRTLPWFDRMNCMYCDYANGLATIFQDELTLIEARIASGVRLSVQAQLLIIVGFIFYYSASTVFKISRFLIYDVMISHPLGLHRLSTQDAKRILLRQGITREYQGFLGKVFENECLLSIKLNNALEQIESAWCPIRHLDLQPDVVLPGHHKLFLEPTEIEEVKRTLQNEGTVSLRKPYR